MATKSKGSGTKAEEQEEVRTLTNLEQVKVLADPLRIKILEAFSEERTTKQVAELLGEKPTKLYHHVDALEKVGLISLVRTRPNRGTTEKYFRAVARTFRADSRIFNAGGKVGSGNNAELQQIITTIIDQTASELTALVSHAHDTDAEDVTKAIQLEGILTFLEVHGTKKEIQEIRAKLNELVRSVTADTKRSSKSNTKEPERYRLTLAYYPLEIKPRSKPSKTPRSKP